MRETLALSFEPAELAELVSSWGLPCWSDPGARRLAIRRAELSAHQLEVLPSMPRILSATPAS